MKSKPILLLLLALLLLNAGWILAFPEASVFYVGNILLHLGLGAGLLGLLWFGRQEALQALRANARTAVFVLSVCGILGLVLAWVGATRPHYWIVAVHGAAGVIGAALVWNWLRARDVRGARVLAAALVAALAMPGWSWFREQYYPREADRVENPLNPPATMEEEGPGVGSPFFPSASNTNTGDLIPSDFFMDSKVCGDCHKDIYSQWEASVHHISSFNNQFYRKSVEYMQETAGVQASKWCAGCHDHAMFFNGRFETPVVEQIDTPEAHAGLGCMSCHAIVHVPDTMGNGGFTIEYPALHDLATSGNTAIAAIQKYVTNIAPAAHRRQFMKPFMRESEFCAACHKVHMDVPVNSYRWFRGFNEYDAWQASGVSGQGARSFYYPPQSQGCADCHMPLVPSDDPGNIGGFVHSHRFPGANTAVPHVNRDEEQLKVQQDFLQSGIVTVDIFAAAPASSSADGPEMLRRGDQSPTAATTFAVGEESGAGPQTVVIREVDKLSAPIDRAQTRVSPGDAVRVDVVVRTRKVGHFFPGGTVDAFDVWVELKAVDAKGRDVFWSGQVLDDGKGPVEPGAHFYRSFLLDEHGNPIDKRNAFMARSLLYARLIPPGAADVARYRIKIPEAAEGPIRLTAKVNYRKFSHYYTQFSYAGQPEPGHEDAFGKGFDDRPFSFSPANIPANVSGKIRGRIPDLPITVVAEAETEIGLGLEEPAWAPAPHADDWERWNDYGIGLLLQGDLRGAQFAFERVIEVRPDWADGWLNIGRSLIREGQTEAARPYVGKALELGPGLARAQYFYALIHKAAGDYGAALEWLRKAAASYPRDRVVLNEIARTLFLQREYQQSLDVLDRVARIDPEDLQLHYTRMLCYRGLGRQEEAELAEALFRRYKADESSQTRTAKIRRLSPEDNNERQAIHEHVSVPLPPLDPEPTDD